MFRKSLSLTVIVSFFLTSLGPLPKAHADSVLGLPAPGTMVNLSPAYEPVIIKGLTVHKDNPFLFDFIVDVGQDKVSGEPLKKEGEKLIKYFLASLAIPDKDVWVNLSPYEKNKMIPEALGQTDMGRDLLAQDYILKQITASLIYPEKQLGKTFWDKVYAKAHQAYGTTQVPVNTFNKVWIMADRAEVFEHNQTAFVVAQHLKVMLEEDYLALAKNQTPTRGHVPEGKEGVIARSPQGDEAISKRTTNDTHTIGSQVIRQIILPELEKEVNTGKNFANLRQIFNSIILSSWYKKNLKEALLNQVYADQSKVKGINLNDPTIKKQIYEQYLKAYKKGVFNYIKEDVDAAGATIPRKYFSGGITRLQIDPVMTHDPAELANVLPQAGRLVDLATLATTQPINPDAAMTAEPEAVKSRPGDHMEIHFFKRVVDALRKQGPDGPGVRAFWGHENEAWITVQFYDVFSPSVGNPLREGATETFTKQLLGEYRRITASPSLRLARDLFASWDKPVGEVASDTEVQVYMDAVVAKYRKNLSREDADVRISNLENYGVKAYVAGRISLGEAVGRFKTAMWNTWGNQPCAQYLVANRMAFLMKAPGSQEKWFNFVSDEGFFEELQGNHADAAMTTLSGGQLNELKNVYGLTNGSLRVLKSNIPDIVSAYHKNGPDFLMRKVRGQEKPVPLSYVEVLNLARDIKIFASSNKTHSRSNPDAVPFWAAWKSVPWNNEVAKRVNEVLGWVVGDNLLQEKDLWIARGYIDGVLDAQYARQLFKKARAEHGMGPMSDDAIQQALDSMWVAVALNTKIISSWGPDSRWITRVSDEERSRLEKQHPVAFYYRAKPEYNIYVLGAKRSDFHAMWQGGIVRNSPYDAYSSNLYWGRWNNRFAKGEDPGRFDDELFSYADYVKNVKTGSQTLPLGFVLEEGMEVVINGVKGVITYVVLPRLGAMGYCKVDLNNGTTTGPGYEFAEESLTDPTLKAMAQARHVDFTLDNPDPKKLLRSAALEHLAGLGLTLNDFMYAEVSHERGSMPLSENSPWIQVGDHKSIKFEGLLSPDAAMAALDWRGQAMRQTLLDIKARDRRRQEAQAMAGKVYKSIQEMFRAVLVEPITGHWFTITTKTGTTRMQVSSISSRGTDITGLGEKDQRVTVTSDEFVSAKADAAMMSEQEAAQLHSLRQQVRALGGQFRTLKAQQEELDRRRRELGMLESQRGLSRGTLTSALDREQKVLNRAWRSHDIAASLAFQNSMKQGKAGTDAAMTAGSEKWDAFRAAFLPPGWSDDHYDSYVRMTDDIFAATFLVPGADHDYLKRELLILLSDHPSYMEVGRISEMARNVVNGLAKAYPQMSSEDMGWLAMGILGADIPQSNLREYEEQARLIKSHIQQIGGIYERVLKAHPQKAGLWTLAVFSLINGETDFEKAHATVTAVNRSIKAGLPMNQEWGTLLAVSQMKAGLDLPSAVGFVLNGAQEMAKHVRAHGMSVHVGGSLNDLGRALQTALVGVMNAQKMIGAGTGRTEGPDAAMQAYNALPLPKDKSTNLEINPRNMPRRVVIADKSGSEFYSFKIASIPGGYQLEADGKLFPIDFGPKAFQQSINGGQFTVTIGHLTYGRNAKIVMKVNVLNFSGQDLNIRDFAMAGQANVARADRATLAEPPGGIDLNTSNGMQWKISKDGNGVEMNVDPATIARVRREGIDSLSPVIFKMTPVVSVWPLMGLQAPA